MVSGFDQSVPVPTALGLSSFEQFLPSERQAENIAPGDTEVCLHSFPLYIVTHFATFMFPLSLNSANSL